MSRFGRRIPSPITWVCTLGIALLSARRGHATPVNIQLDDFSLQPQTHTAPMMRGNGARVVAVWNDARTLGSTTEPRIHYAVSTDSGATFTDAGAPPSPVNGSGTWRWRSDPQLVMNPTGSDLYIACYATVGAQTGIWVIKGNFGGPTVTWGAAALARTVSGGVGQRPGQLALEANFTTGVVHLLVHTTATHAIEYQRSIDGNGAVWSAPVTLSSGADLGNVAYPRIVALDDTVYAAWVGPMGFNTQPIRVRSSSNGGASWGIEQTAAVMRMNPTFPGISQTNTTQLHRPQFSLAVNRTSGSSTFGRVAVAWGESWDFSDEPFPALTSTVLRTESEPNGDLSSATPFNLGDALTASLADGNDFDFWQVTLAAGDAFTLWGDSTVTSVLRIWVYGPDGFAMNNGFAGSSSTAFGLRAPIAGTYSIQVQGGSAAAIPWYYRIRTRAGSPGAGEARDQRDLAVAYSTPSGWTVRRHAFGPIGYDDYLATIGFAADGLDYVTWYDLSRGSASGRSHLVVARNLAGADPVVSAPVTVTSEESDWNDYLVIFPPGIGLANDVSGTSQRALLAWSDFRFTESNAYAATVPTGAFPVAFPNDTTVVPNSVVTLHGQVLNRNTLFDEKLLVSVTGARSWPGALAVRDSVPPASNGVISIPIAIPDTAAAGVYTVTVTYRRQSGVVLGSDPVNLTIQGTSGVGDAVATARLEPVKPNPTRGAARIAFTLARPGEARVEVFGIHGERVRMLARGTMAAGARSLDWNGRDDQGHTVPAGLYFVALETDGFRAVRSVVILR